MRIPPALARTWSHDPRWLEALPDMASACAERWSLELEAPIDTPHSLVVPAGDAVLKLNPPTHDDAEREGDALGRWSGRGAVRLLAHDDELRALLLERCVPGTRLWDGDAEEVDVVTEIVPQVQLPLEERHPFTLLADAADRWAEDVPRWFARAGSPFERALLDAALDVYRTVDRSATWLVNQDLHGENILFSARGWLVIDPQPLAGERELEASGLLRNAATGAEISRWLDALADLGLDRERARGWGVAHNLAWAWDEHRGWLDANVEKARRIFSAP